MNKLHHSKSKKQLHTEKVIKRIAVIFITGAICGAGLTTLIHKCEAATIEPVPVKTEYVLQSSGWFKCTAYCKCRKCCGKWSAIGKTASGTIPTQGRTIAVDKSVISLGTNVIIDGHQYTAEDTGKAIKGNRIDIYFDNHQEALEFGVQYKEVFIIKKG